MDKNKKEISITELTANLQVNNENTIKVEESTPTSKKSFSQTMKDSQERILKEFKENSTVSAVEVEDAEYVDEPAYKRLEPAEAAAKAIYDKYQANITPAWDLINSPNVEIRYVLDKLLPMGDLCLIYGDSGDYKSTFMRGILFAIAYGMDEYLGFKIDLPPEKRKDCIVITEDSPSSIKSLLQKQAQYFDQFRTIENPVFDIISCCENGIIFTLQERMKDVDYSMVVIDTPQDDILGSMNDNNVVRAYLHQLSTLGAMYTCTMVGIHHKRKYTLDKAPSKEDLSGTRALYDKPRSVFELRKDVDDANAVYLSPVKSNYQKNDFLKESYRFIVDQETLTFSFEGELSPSDQIHLSTYRRDNSEAIEATVADLRTINPKISQIEISEILREAFPDEPFSQSKVSRILTKLKKKK